MKAGKAYYINFQNSLCKTQNLSPDAALLLGPTQFLFSPVFSPSWIHLQMDPGKENRNIKLLPVGKNLFSRYALGNIWQFKFLGSLRWWFLLKKHLEVYNTSIFLHVSLPTLIFVYNWVLKSHSCKLFLYVLFTLHEFVNRSYLHTLAWPLVDLWQLLDSSNTISFPYSLKLQKKYASK